MPSGKRQIKAKKLKYRNKINSKLLSDHQSIITKTRKLIQPTKKLNCPVTFQVKKLFHFPEFKIDTDTKWNRSLASKKLKKFIIASSDVSFNKAKQPGKYDKIKISPLGILYEIPFKRYLINRLKFCANTYSKIVFVGTTYVRFLCL